MLLQPQKTWGYDSISNAIVKAFDTTNYQLLANFMFRVESWEEMCMTMMSKKQQATGNDNDYTN